MLNLQPLGQLANMAAPMIQYCGLQLWSVLHLYWNCDLLVHRAASTLICALVFRASRRPQSSNAASVNGAAGGPDENIYSEPDEIELVIMNSTQFTAVFCITLVFKFSQVSLVRTKSSAETLWVRRPPITWFGE